MRVSIVVGNPNPQSRTLKVASALVEQLLVPGSYDLTVIDLADYKEEIFSSRSERVAAQAAVVAGSDLAVFASPTYKATYTGLLKSFLDLYPSGGLGGVVAIPVLTGGDAAHSMGPTHNLAPLLIELGATVPGRGFYFISERMVQLDELVSAAAAEYSRNFSSLAQVSQFVRPAAELSDRG